MGRAMEELESIKTTAEEKNLQTKYLTKAELSHKIMQRKMEEKRIMEKAALTHKQRVEKFNEHLDNLTEHFDIPKVSILGIGV
ncbi:Protein FAM32A [Pseudolycoriella hygida]|uniref:Protein FAM32A n=1 Tax=Pseudolycoriella hygida TaxID=35572 RepID=A0A9Q0S5B8_9DIPT|nr:Protein FAM32A [Pseudolycoriella hygida]